MRRRVAEGDRARQEEIRRGAILMGTQGFSYDQWEGLVYPVGLPKGERLPYYARRFALVELDSTYYATPRAAQVARWAEQTPEGFTFTAKVPKQITQEARLAGEVATRELARFLGTMHLMGSRLGPIVFQMSPGFRAPRDFPALELTLRHLADLGGEGMRFAVEFRHPSWLEGDEPAALLAECGVAWVWNDWYPTEPYLLAMPRAIDTPAAQKVTADDFAYLRLTGNHAACVDYRTMSIDRQSDLERWAHLALEFRRGREDRGVYVLLNNHYAGSSPLAVRELERALGLPVIPFGVPEDGAQQDGAQQDGAQPEQEGRLRLPGL